MGFQLTTRAQINLVENPSFEDLKLYDSTINSNLFINAKHWHGTDSTQFYNNPSIFFTYYSNFFQLPIPDASWGNGGVYQYPRSGKVVGEIVIYADSSSSFNPISYAVGKLNKPLEAGVHYCVTFYTNLAKPLDECIATNHVCAYVGDSTIDTIQNSRGLIIHNITPQIQCANVISDTMNWTKPLLAQVCSVDLCGSELVLNLHLTLAQVINAQKLCVRLAPAGLS